MFKHARLTYQLFKFVSVLSKAFGFVASFEESKFCKPIKKMLELRSLFDEFLCSCFFAKRKVPKNTVDLTKVFTCFRNKPKGEQKYKSISTTNKNFVGRTLHKLFKTTLARFAHYKNIQACTVDLSAF